jgi:hypothetical protein
LTPLSGSVAFEAQERFHQFVMHRIEQGKQEGIDQHDHAKQLETGFQ